MSRPFVLTYTPTGSPAAQATVTFTLSSGLQQSFVLSGPGTTPTSFTMSAKPASATSITVTGLSMFSKQLSFDLAQSEDPNFAQLQLPAVAVTIVNQSYISLTAANSPIAPLLSGATVTLTAGDVFTLQLTPSTAPNSTCLTELTVPSSILTDQPTGILSFANASRDTVNLTLTATYALLATSTQTLSFGPLVCADPAYAGYVIPPVSIQIITENQRRWAPLAALFIAFGVSLIYLIVFGFCYCRTDDCYSCCGYLTDECDVAVNAEYKLSAYSMAVVQPAIVTAFVVVSNVETPLLVQYTYFTPQSLLVMSYTLAFISAVGSTIVTRLAQRPTVQRYELLCATLVISTGFLGLAAESIVLFTEFESQPTGVFPKFWLRTMAITVGLLALAVVFADWKRILDVPTVAWRMVLVGNGCVLLRSATSKYRAAMAEDRDRATLDEIDQYALKLEHAASRIHRSRYGEQPPLTITELLAQPAPVEVEMMAVREQKAQEEEEEEKGPAARRVGAAGIHYAASTGRPRAACRSSGRVPPAAAGVQFTVSHSQAAIPCRQRTTGSC